MPSLSSILMLLRGIGPASLLGILTNTRQKNRLNRVYQNSTVGPLQEPGQYLGYAQIDGAVIASFSSAHARFAFLAPDLLHVSWLLDPASSAPLPGYAIARHTWPQVPFDIRQEPDCLVINSSALHISLNPDGAFQIRSQDGSLLRSELPSRFQHIQANSLHPPLVRWISRAALDADEFLAGLGEHSGPLALRQRSFKIWNTDPGGAHDSSSDPLYMPLPVYLSLRKTGSSLVFYNNSSLAHFEFDPPAAPGQPAAPGLAIATFETGALEWFFIAGPPAQVLERFSELTGRPALPPLWSLGYHQSRWGYKSAADIRQVVAGFKEHDLPMDSIHLDIDYMDGFRVFSVDKKRFPDLPGLAAEMQAQNVRLVTIIDPGVKQDHAYPIYKQGEAAGHFVKLPGAQPLTGMVWPGKCSFPDFTHPAVRQWWGECCRFLTDAGVDGIWHDMNEPAAFTASGEPTLPFAAQHNLDGCPGDHLQAHNLYGLQMNRAGWEGLRRLRPERRPWILSRSGWVGNCRYAWNWTADVATSWENLHQTIATLLGMGLSGTAFSGSDIGGFTGDPSPELYLRWFQMAAFNAFMRTHSVVGAAPRHPWMFGEPYLTYLRDALRLRQRFLPYLYTLAWQCSQTGAPFVRPLFWCEPDNPHLWPVDDAFLCGDALLVAPVWAPGAASRSIALPSGTWFDYWSDETLVGPAVRELPVVLEKIPLLVRDNSLLPLVVDGQLQLHVYLDRLDQHHAPCLIGQLYSDAGDGYGPSRVDRFLLSPHNNRLALTWQAEGDFPFPYTGYELFFHGRSLKPTPIISQKSHPPPLDGSTSMNNLVLGYFEE